MTNIGYYTCRPTGVHNLQPTHTFKNYALIGDYSILTLTYRPQYADGHLELIGKIGYQKSAMSASAMRHIFCCMY